MTAMNTGAKASYTDTAPQVRDVQDLITIVSPKDVPLLKVVVGLAENNGKPPRIDTLSQPCFSTKYEWLEDTLDPTSDTLGAAVSDTTGTNWTVADGTKFRKGHVVQCGSEIVWVSGVSSNTVSVTRGFGASTPATHANNSALEIIGIAMLEGDDAPAARTTPTTNPYNYTQIFEVPIKVTGTQAALRQYGIADEYKYQTGKAFTSACILLERAIFQGRRSASGGTTTAARAMGGFPTFITQHIADLSDAALTEKDINDLLEGIFISVGASQMPQDIFVGSWLKRKISAMYAPNARMDRGERVAGVVVDKIATDMGEVSVHLGLYNPPASLYAVNLDHLEIGPLRGRGFAEKKLAISGDYMLGEIVGEYVLALRNDNAHGAIINCSLTS